MMAGVCKGGWRSAATDGFGSVAAEASWGLDRLQFEEVEVADCPQCICRCSVLEIVGPSLKPGGIVGLGAIFWRLKAKI
jgi:hypothetical protein